VHVFILFVETLVHYRLEGNIDAAVNSSGAVSLPFHSTLMACALVLERASLTMNAGELKKVNGIILPTGTRAGGALSFRLSRSRIYGRPRKEPMRFSGSMRSQKILKVAKMGTASNVPATPQR
jgi:hypothetical protein